MTGQRHDLVVIIPPGPDAKREAKRTLGRFLHEIAEKRNPRTSATVSSTVRPTHWSRHEHACDRRCTRPHVCHPSGASVVRHVQFLLSGAFERAVRWRWVGINPVTMASPPAAPRPNPQPLSPREAARIVEESWKDPDWGALVWTAMTTGARRGELCAIRLHSVDLDEGRETLWLRRAIRKEHGVLVEAELKTHQQRRVALDAETAEILREHIERARTRAASLGSDLSANAFLFSGSPDSSTFPDTSVVLASVCCRIGYTGRNYVGSDSYHWLAGILGPLNIDLAKLSRSSQRVDASTAARPVSVRRATPCAKSLLTPAST